MSGIIRIACAISGTLTILACSTQPLVCIAEPVPPLRVYVTDATTGSSIASIARGVAIGVTVTDSLRHSVGADPAFLYGGEGPGPFTVEVEAAGYTRWTKTGVEVESKPDQCGEPFRVTLTAVLQRE